MARRPRRPEVVVGVAPARGALRLLPAQTVGSRKWKCVPGRGVLLQRLYKEGAAVTKNEVLFQIDPAPLRRCCAGSTAPAARANQLQARRNRDRVPW
jgi:multidrug efflux pump subunit AcrA (membrane-fusion protein)